VLSLLLIAGFLAGTSLLLLTRATSADSLQKTGVGRMGAVLSESRLDSRGDPLPRGAIRRFGSVRYQPGGRINNAALSPDGRWLATAGQSGIVVWELSTGRPVQRLKRRPVVSDDYNRPAIVFSRDGRFLSCLDARIDVERMFPRDLDRSIHKWDLRTGKKVSNLVLRDDPTEDIDDRDWTSCFGPDGKDLFVATSNGHVFRIDTATRKQQWTYDLGPREGRLNIYRESIAVSPDGKLLAVSKGMGYRDAILIETTTGKAVRSIMNPEEVLGLCFSPDGASLAIANTAAGKARLYDVKTGREKVVCRFERGRFWSCRSPIAFSPDSRTLFAATEHDYVQGCDLDSGKSGELIGTGGDIRHTIDTLFVTPDGRTVVATAGLTEGAIYRWDPATGKEIHLDDGYKGAVRSRLSHDGKLVAVGDAAGRLELFDAQTGRRVHLLRDAGERVSLLRWSPDDKLLAADQGQATLWDPNSGHEDLVLREPRRNPEGTRWDVQPNALAFSPDGRQLVTSGNCLQLRDVSTGETKWAREELYLPVFSPDGKTVAAIGEYGVPYLLDAATGLVRSNLKGLGNILEPSGIRALAISPEGTWFATAHLDGTIRLRNPNTGAEVKQLAGPAGSYCTAMDFSPDGKWLLRGESDGCLSIVEVATGKELLRREGHGGYVTDVSFGPDLRTALSSSIDGTALMWDLRPQR
jgi:WD40 repeat protein